MEQRQQLKAISRLSTLEGMEIKFLVYFKLFWFMVELVVQFIRNTLRSHMCNLRFDDSNQHRKPGSYTRKRKRH